MIVYPHSECDAFINLFNVPLTKYRRSLTTLTEYRRSLTPLTEYRRSLTPLTKYLFRINFNS